MSLYTLKPRFQTLLRPAAGALHRLGATANQVTLAAAVGSLLVGCGLGAAAHFGRVGWFCLLPVWFLLRMALNALDGMLAREFGQSSALGAYLNELADVVSDAALYAPFALLPGGDARVIAALIFLSMLCEFAGVLGIAVGGRRCNDGPMGKSDRALVFGGLGLLVGVELVPPAGLFWLPCLVSLLLLVTIVHRVKSGLAESSGRPRRQTAHRE